MTFQKEMHKHYDKNPGVPFVAISAHAFVAMMTKWAYDIPRNMGMVKVQHKEAAHATLKVFLICIASMCGGLKFDIDMVQKFNVVWHRPLPHHKSDTLVMNPKMACASLMTLLIVLQSTHPPSGAGGMLYR